jgi:hypothetical protein
MNLLPEHLEHQFTQLLFIGEKKSAGTGEVLDQLEKLEEEDEQRVKHLHGETLCSEGGLTGCRRGCGVQGFAIEQGGIQTRRAPR